MAIFDIFKRRKKIEEKKEKLEKEVKETKKLEEKEIKVEAIPRKERKMIGEAYRILKVPQVTEKSTDLVGKNQYSFKVWPEANKMEIKKAIENLYGVDVISVKIINVPRKRRRLRRIFGWRTGYKKAIVKIKEGQKIEVLPR